MKRVAIAGSLMLVAFAGVVLADEKALKELEGKYAVTHAEKAGKILDKAKLDTLKVAIAGDELTLTVEGKAEKQELKAKLKVNAAVTPHTIDLLPTDGEYKGKTFPGIYKLEKGEVTLAYTEEGDRPKEFKAENKVMLLQMKKAK
jgi:uncharacterized protein (TIGR03067 family)